jgi:hypothetical protein
MDRLCDLVVRVTGYRSGGPGRFPALPDFLRSSESGTGPTHPLSTMRSYMKEKVAAAVYKNRDYGHTGSAAVTTLHPSIRKVGTNFADKFARELRPRSLFINIRCDTDTDTCIFVCIFVHICVNSFHRCYTRFGAHPNYIHIKIVVKTTFKCFSIKQRHR